MITVKYDVPYLDYNTRFSLWQAKMWAIHAEMDLDDTLLGFDHMTSRFPKEKYCKKKVLYIIYLYLSNQNSQDV